MRIVALCPTYRRRTLLANAVACFLAQTHDDKKLIVCDDSGESPYQREADWQVIPSAPYASLPDKYNAMARYAIKCYNPDAFAVFEDDDVYFPDYLANHVKALQTESVRGFPCLWSHCSWCWTDGSGGPNGGELRREDTGHGRLHGCLAFSRELFEQTGGWPTTRRMDFDLQMLALLRVTSPADPCQFGPSQYFFRWASTGQPHGQAYCSGPDDEGWMQKAQTSINARLGPVRPLLPLRPAMDAETARLYAASLQQRERGAA